MNKKVSDSIRFLLAEYKRLRQKKEKMQLTLSEKETLKNLLKFLGKNK